MEVLTEALTWLYSLEGRGEIYKLERMDQALELIGNPHRRLRAVHIAGTKGKGSVAAMVDSCLRAQGYRCGLYTKPHLVSLTERTRINGVEMDQERMLAYIARLRTVFERAGLALTFFEFTVCLMFLYFAEAAVDLAVIETGLGGRLDSTNVVTPILSVITPIGFDHMEQLGYTITSIAREKGGIIKRGIPVVIGTRDREAQATLLPIAAERSSPATLVDRDYSYRSVDRRRIDYTGGDLRLQGVELGVRGTFQHENAAIALAALEALRAQGIAISEAALRRGMRDVYWPGRFDIVGQRPTVILDCAHNELAIEALLESLRVELGDDVRPILVFGCLEDKNWRRMAAMLAPRVSRAFLTRVKPKRPLEPEHLLPLFASQTPAQVVREPRSAIEAAMAQAAANDVVLVTGSVYLVGEIYSWVLEQSGRRELFPERPA
ncbi:MAG TPA: folylpolyglutamate synthase/dihydrofolate synthase family protein [Candidatus Binataceae bacterium]|nr:folylpolyglutamate synthase/dihydrofolate synthase family protein [Candidatus Binataceae bacterium]